MNKQTRSGREFLISTKVSKGTPVGKREGAVASGALTFVPFESTKGRAVNSHNERAKQGRKPWMGALKQRPKSLGNPEDKD